MSETSSTAGKPENSASIFPHESSDKLVPATEKLENRIQRLEDMISYLCDKDGLESRLVSRLNQASTPQAAPLTRPALETSKGEVITAQPVPTVPTTSLMDFALPPPSGPLVPVQHQPPKSTIQSGWQAAKLFTKVLPESSIIRDLWWDMRTGFAMFRDHLYPMTLACRIVPLFALLYVTVWPIFSAWTGLIGTVMNGLVNVIVLFIGFKVLQRELKRYYAFVEKYHR